MEGKFASSSWFGKNRENEKMNICTPEDLKSIMARKESLPKCPSWNSFAIPDSKFFSLPFVCFQCTFAIVNDCAFVMSHFVYPFCPFPHPKNTSSYLIIDFL